jgi:hypothetical protein
MYLRLPRLDTSVVLTLICTAPHRQQAVVWAGNIRVRHDMDISAPANPGSQQAGGILLVTLNPVDVDVSAPANPGSQQAGGILLVNLRPVTPRTTQLKTAQQVAWLAAYVNKHAAPPKSQMAQRAAGMPHTQPGERSYPRCTQPQTAQQVAWKAAYVNKHAAPTKSQMAQQAAGRKRTRTRHADR